MNRLAIYCALWLVAALANAAAEPANTAANTAAKAATPEVAETLLAEIRSGGMGFTSLLVVQHQLLNPSHVYTYHQENLKPGGGLWTCDLSGQQPRLERIIDSPEGLILDANIHDGHRCGRVVGCHP